MEQLTALLSSFLFAILLATALCSYTIPAAACSNQYFRCANDQCINKAWYCDGREDCTDGSDERLCNHRSSYHRCHPSFHFECNSFSDSRFKCIPKEWKCDGLDDCRDGADEKLEECIPKRPCNQSEFRCKNERCIPKSQLCDGTDNCKDNSDENCWRWLLHNRQVERSINTLKTFLQGKRIPDHHWGKESPRALVAYYFVNKSAFSLPLALKEELTIKIIENNFAISLLKNSSEVVTPINIALFIHSLLPACINPQTTFGIDLVAKLMKMAPQEGTHYSPIIPLAICNSGENIDEYNLARLYEYINSSSTTPFDTDLKSQAILALECGQRRSQAISENLLIKASSELKLLQEEDGSFGNLHTTCLVVQAMMALQDRGEGWDFAKAIQYILAKQKEDGSFEDSMVASYLVAPVLVGQTLLDLQNEECIRNWTREEERLNEIKELMSKTMHVKYNLWIGDKKDFSYAIGIRVPDNITLFDLMMMASKDDPKFKMEYKTYDWGAYVYSLSGLTNNPEHLQYWQVYKVTGEEITKADSDVTKIALKDQDEYVIWYHTKTS